MALLETVTEAPAIVTVPDAPALVVADECQTLHVEATAALLILSRGEQGPAGISPAGADKHFEHVQAVPSAVWTVTHNLDKKPAVTVLDSAGEQCEGEVDYPSQNVVEITFTAPFSGLAVCN